MGRERRAEVTGSEEECRDNKDVVAAVACQGRAVENGSLGVEAAN